MLGPRTKFLAAVVLGVATTFATAWAGVLVPGRLHVEELRLPRPPREYRERRALSQQPWSPETATESYRTAAGWAFQEYQVLTGSGLGFRGSDLRRLFERIRSTIDEGSAFAQPEYQRWFSESPDPPDEHVTCWTLIEAGFPYPAVRATSWRAESGESRSAGAVAFGAPTREADDQPRTLLPVMPNWVGFAAHSGLYMALWATVLYGSSLLRRDRTTAGAAWNAHGSVPTSGAGVQGSCVRGEQ